MRKELYSVIQRGPCGQACIEIPEQKNMNMIRLNITMITMSWLWLAGTASDAAVIYSEDFTGLGSTQGIQAGGTYAAPLPTGWDLYGTQGAGYVVDTYRLWDYKAQNAGGAIVNEAQAPIASSQPQLTFSVQLHKVQNADASDYLEAVLMVEMDNSQWYAWDRNDEITATQSSDQWDTVSWIFDPTASNWQMITLAREIEPVKGSFASTDLSGQITGFGIYHDRDGLGDNTLNMNSFTITIPEPSSLMLIGIAGMFAFIRRR